MSAPAIVVSGISKSYRIGSPQRYKALRDTLSSMLYAPFRAAASLASPRSPSSAKQYREYIWALKNVSFEVGQGEVIGIIGRNGSGKTTLLKILSRITEPTEGTATIHGRVGSLLEVGTGFHPELTGRENTYLNGAILGMKKSEINRKFDEIVEFAEVEKFIDTPVKLYSSGMYLRLAFSVAAHLEPEILIVDEVLAVGDVEFQRKCLGKMGSIAREGRTVLFVSHQMSAIRNLCSRTILLDHGDVLMDDQTDRTVSTYLGRNQSQGGVVFGDELSEKAQGVILRAQPTVRVRRIAITNAQGEVGDTFYSDEEIKVEVEYECFVELKDLRVNIQIVTDEALPILDTQNAEDPAYLDSHFTKQPGTYRSFCILPSNLFGGRRFYLNVHLINPKVEHLVFDQILGFDVQFKGYNNIQYTGPNQAFIHPLMQWQTEKIAEKSTAELSHG